MHLNRDARQVVIDTRLFGLLMAYAWDAARAAGQADEAQVIAIERHAVKFNRHVRENIPLVLQPGFLLQQKQEHARDIRAWAARTGTKAYLRVTQDCGTDEYYLPVTVLGRSSLSQEGLRHVVVRPYPLNLEQYQALSRHRRITGRTILSGSKIKLAHHPLTGPVLIHASWMNDRPEMTFAAAPSHLKSSLPEGAYECHGGILNGLWRVPPLSL